MDTLEYTVPLKNPLINNKKKKRQMTKTLASLDGKKNVEIHENEESDFLKQEKKVNKEEEQEKEEGNKNKRPC